MESGFLIPTGTGTFSFVLSGTCGTWAMSEGSAHAEG